MSSFRGRKAEEPWLMDGGEVPQGPGTAPIAAPESRFIILRDQSSSMSLVPSFPKVWNQQVVSLARLIPSASAIVYSVSKHVEKNGERVPLSQLEEIDESRWHFRAGGMLKGGTALGDAIIRGCQKALLFRRGGFTGPIGLFLLTDGWSRNDTQPLSKARQWLDYARDELGVTFRLVGFVTPVTQNRLERFKEEVGIRNDEDQSICYSLPEQRAQSMSNAVEKLGEEVLSTACRQMPVELMLKLSKWES